MRVDPPVSRFSSRTNAPRLREAPRQQSRDTGQRARPGNRHPARADIGTFAGGRAGVYASEWVRKRRALAPATVELCEDDFEEPEVTVSPTDVTVHQADVAWQSGCQTTKK